MYEDKTRRAIEINWKSLLIKLGILLVVVFLIIWIVSLFNKDDENASNFGTNLSLMRDAATEYFTGSRLPSEINESVRLTLGEMFERNLLVEFQDENGNSCDTENSYIEATKLDDENYRIEVRLVCDNDSDTIINTVKYQSQEEDNNQDEGEDPIIDDDDELDDTNTDDGSDNNGTSDNTNNGSSNNNNNSNGGNNSNNGNHNNQGNNNNNNNNNNSDNGGDAIATACPYGKKEYSTKYPLAYVVSGDCAVSSSSISGSHANNATRVGTSEYLKLVKEMQDLENKTGVEIQVNHPEYSKILNKTGNGYVGYQIYFSAKQVSTYSKKTIYSYYLDQNGNRTVIIDSRNSLGNSNNINNGNDSTNRPVTSIELNRSSLSLEVEDTYTLKATITPSNATNRTISWSSSNTRVATVSSSGKVTARGEGTATITAKAENKKATVKVTVEKEVVTKTYYLMSYVDSSYVGKYYVQDFVFNDINRSNVDFVYVTVDYYDGYSDFNRYTNIKNNDREIELYLGYKNEGNLQVVGARDLYNHSLDRSNFTFANTMATTMGGRYGVRITTYINNVSGVSKYSNSYFVPLKVTVTYKQ